VPRFLVPVACALVQALSITPGGGFDPSPASSLAASLAGLASGLLLLRRSSAAVLVLAGATAGYLVQAALTGAVLPVVLVVATFGLSRRALLRRDGGPRRDALSALAAAAVVVVVSPVAAGAELAVQYAVLLLVAALSGLLLAQRAVRDATERQQLVQAERLRLSRDLHDVVGHGLSAITVQAGAARLAVTAGEDRAAVRALAEIERAGRDVLREVRWLVTLLREDDGERPRLAEVPELVAGARRSGLDVRLDVHGDLGGVGRDVGEAGYRLVQEALTNVLRHAPGAAAAVVVEVAAELRIEVSDEGSAAAVDAAESNGLRGMRERVTALGGTVEAGPRRAAGVGWSVCARLPLRAVAR
jgi:signal transduction histidine kinase